MAGFDDLEADRAIVTGAGEHTAAIRMAPNVVEVSHKERGCGPSCSLW